ncbi:hypothetical protein [Saccharopolyspora cebuensis]|uniref:hypothetical protein n=1 Tax=Saccharopolyspora cebuensis TaxID=418759 RepID=UPI0035105C1D
MDLARDATVADLRGAVGAGLTSAEHIERCTTIGTAHDQGKTSGTRSTGAIADPVRVTRARPARRAGESADPRRMIGEGTSSHSQRIAHPGACGKTRVLPQNRRTEPGAAGTEVLSAGRHVR